MSQPTAAEIRGSVYETLSEIASAFASPARLKVIQILAQSPRGVEELARETGESIANVSQHLQRLSKAGVVACERKGVSRIYRVTSPRVLSVWESFQDLGHEIAPVLDARENSLTDLEMRAVEPATEVLRAARLGKVDLIDVRAEAEAGATPVRGARLIPLEAITSARNLRELGLSKSRPVYALCRGRYCSLATDAVKHLRKLGGDAYRLRESPFRLNSIDRGDA